MNNETFYVGNGRYKIELDVSHLSVQEMVYLADVIRHGESIMKLMETEDATTRHPVERIVRPQRRKAMYDEYQRNKEKMAALGQANQADACTRQPEVHEWLDELRNAGHRRERQRAARSGEICARLREALH